MDTPTVRQWFAAHDPEAARREVVGGNPLERIADPKEVGEASSRRTCLRRRAWEATAVGMPQQPASVGQTRMGRYGG
jgi:hypothetical protein